MKLSRCILDRIEDPFGCSFYILDVNQFTENYRNLLQAFQIYYPNTHIAYSYKTNYTPRICQLVDEFGGWAEVVSDMEYQVALRAGIPPRKVFFNGPYKKAAAIEDLLLQGGIVNADSMHELRKISEIAFRHPEATLKIGLRCNFDVNDGVLSRFGFDVDSGDLDAAKQFINEIPNLHLAGLHCHFADRSLETWRYGAAGMLNLLRKHFQEGGDALAFASLGGGLYGKMPPSLRAQFNVEIPSYEDYAEAAAKPFADFFRGFNHTRQPMLIIEPGTALVADAMKFTAKVISIKSIRGKIIATLTGSIYNINPTPNRKNLPITIFHQDSSSNVQQQYDNVDFAGYTCIESDYLYRNYCGKLAVDDFVVFNDVGAYSIVMKPPFILPNFAIVEYNEESGSVDLIKRPETFEDLFHTYKF